MSGKNSATKSGNNIHKKDEDGIYIPGEYMKEFIKLFPALIPTYNKLKTDPTKADVVNFMNHFWVLRIMPEIFKVYPQQCREWGVLYKVDAGLLSAFYMSLKLNSPKVPVKRDPTMAAPNHRVVINTILAQLPIETFPSQVEDSAMQAYYDMQSSGQRGAKAAQRAVKKVAAQTTSPSNVSTATPKKRNQVRLPVKPKKPNTQNRGQRKAKSIPQDTLAVTLLENLENAEHEHTETQPASTSISNYAKTRPLGGVGEHKISTGSPNNDTPKLGETHGDILARTGVITQNDSQTSEGPERSHQSLGQKRGIDSPNTDIRHKKAKTQSNIEITKPIKQKDTNNGKQKPLKKQETSQKGGTNESEQTKVAISKSSKKTVPIQQSTKKTIPIQQSTKKTGSINEPIKTKITINESNKTTKRSAKTKISINKSSGGKESVKIQNNKSSNKIIKPGPSKDIDKKDPLQDDSTETHAKDEDTSILVFESDSENDDSDFNQYDNPDFYHYDTLC